MLIHIIGAKCIGIDAVKVVVEVEIDRGIGIHMVGLADVAVKESLLRTTTALESLGFKIPGKKIIINLAPADLKKNGSGYDLPIALGIIAASGQRDLRGLDKYVIMGELGLDGSLRPIQGALPMAEMVQKEGLEGIILPVESALEAMDFRSMKVYGVRNVEEVLRILEERVEAEDLLIWNSRLYNTISRDDSMRQEPWDGIDFSEIVGQEGAKRAIEIAAAGGHNIIMVGAPGSGKSSLAKAMAGILPPMTQEESLLTSKVYSIVGKSSPQYGLIRKRPFRAPHCSATLAAIIGGGSGENILPGEVSMAANGVLFLDELAQMPRSTIESLRAPIEDRKVVISRLRSKVEFPANFMLVAASNPCPCGFYGEGDRCTCTPAQRTNYINKLSGPLMDRIDLQCWLHTVDSGKIINASKGETSMAVAQRVADARKRQKERFAGETIMTNAEMSNKQIEKYCRLSPECQATMKRIMDTMKFSMRAYFRIIKVARTIADLAGEDEIRASHLMEASSFRFLDRHSEL
ncbi:MAG: YifB family Mg chelatase-like AAA ATPase [Bacteroidales bacterium]|nr:YifB family Mg chelatase-like AAA ATPase [Bacteroidales bacterium]